MHRCEAHSWLELHLQARSTLLYERGFSLDLAISRLANLDLLDCLKPWARRYVWLFTHMLVIRHRFSSFHTKQSTEPLLASSVNISQWNGMSKYVDTGIHIKAKAFAHWKGIHFVLISCTENNCAYGGRGFLKNLNYKIRGKNKKVMNPKLAMVVTTQPQLQHFRNQTWGSLGVWGQPGV